MKVGDEVRILNGRYAGQVGTVIARKEYGCLPASLVVKLPTYYSYFQELTYDEDEVEFVEENEMNDQEAKKDAGKLELSLVPFEIIRAIARVRMFAVHGKYKDPDNWKKVEAVRYRNAAYRHWLAYLEDPYGVDEESGLKHLDHVACNIAFLCELEKDMISNPSGGVDMK